MPEPDTLFEKQIRIVFGVDQEPFEGGGNLFCLAHPLLVESTGELLRAEDFKNRGRLWWLVNDVDTDELVPGCLHTAEIERAPQFDGALIEKDEFQVRLKRREANSSVWAQVVRVRGAAPSIDELMLRGVPLPYRPLKLVLVRYDDQVLGPFVAIWSQSTKRARLRKWAHDYRAYSLPPDALDATRRVVEVRWDSCMYDRSGAPRREITTTLFRRDDVRPFFHGQPEVDLTPLEHVATRLARRLEADGRPLFEEVEERLRRLVEISADEQDAEWSTRLLRAIRDLREETGLAADFPQSTRTELQRFLPPASEAPRGGEGEAERGPKVESLHAPARASEPPAEAAAIEEIDFLHRLKRAADAEGFQIDAVDLATFHLGLKAGAWSVLAGPSGTGKSTLPRLYAKALGTPDSLLTVSVRPDWVDDRDVIGSWDVFSKRFVPAATGLVDFLIRAQTDESGLHLILLDEMNLARVEYYFAGFLSILELPPAERALSLFSPGLAESKDPYAPYARMRIPENVRIVGTVNVDETTHFFSPKVLDRAGVQVFGRPDLLEAAFMETRPAETAFEPVAWSTWSNWVRDHRQAERWVGERLSQLNEPLTELRSGMGHRVFQRCLRFVAGAAGLDDVLSTGASLDAAILLYVLPRVRTDVPGFTELGEALLDLLPESELPRSHAIVRSMLEAEGRNDFWQLL